MHVRLKGRDIDKEDEFAEDVHVLTEKYLKKLQLKADIQMEIK